MCHCTTRFLASLFTTFLMMASVAADKPATSQPAGDDDVEWILSHATDLPNAPSSQPATTRPASQPVSPFESAGDPTLRHGAIVLSNGERVPGNFATTRDKPLRIYDANDREYHDVPFALIRSMRARVLWERDEDEWAFQTSGSDVKIKTGKTYPARQTEYEVTLANGQTITGGVVAPLYLRWDDREKLFVLNKRAKGTVGQSLKDLVYVARVELEE